MATKLPEPSTDLPYMPEIDPDSDAGREVQAGLEQLAADVEERRAREAAGAA